MDLEYASVDKQHQGRERSPKYRVLVGGERLVDATKGVIPVDGVTTLNVLVIDQTRTKNAQSDALGLSSNRDRIFRLSTEYP